MSSGNAVQVAEFLANQTSGSKSGDAQDVEAVSDILMNIVQAGSGDKKVELIFVLQTIENFLYLKNRFNFRGP